MIELYQLFVSFARSSLLGFGGGPSMVLLIQDEVITLRGWLSLEEFLDVYAFGNALPSPIATKLASFIGFHVAGWPGAIAALAGVAVPTALLLILLASLFMRHRKNRVINAMIEGVRPVVVALLVLVVWDFLAPVFGVTPGDWLSNWHLILVALVSLVLLLRYRVHPVPLIVAGGLVGMLFALLPA